MTKIQIDLTKEYTSSEVAKNGFIIGERGEMSGRQIRRLCIQKRLKAEVFVPFGQATVVYKILGADIIDYNKRRADQMRAKKGKDPSALASIQAQR